MKKETCLKISIVALFLLIFGLTSSYGAELESDWSLKAYFDDLIANYPFPFDRNIFAYPQRVFVFKIEEGYILEDDNNVISSPEVPRLRPGDTYLAFNLATIKNCDIKIEFYSSSSATIISEKEYINICGEINFFLDLGIFTSDKLFYRIFVKEDDVYKAVVPLCAVMNPLFRNEAAIWATGDSHVFEDNCLYLPKIVEGESAVQSFHLGRYYYEFLKYLIKYGNNWVKYADNKIVTASQTLKFTYNIAQRTASIIKGNVLLDAIFLLGDDVCPQAYRLERQGFIQPYNLQEASYTLYKKHRTCDILGSLIPTYQVIGNHEGGYASDPSFISAIEARKKFFPQPADFQNGSIDQNYFMIPFAGGKNEVYVLDVVSYSGNNGKGFSPEFHKFGETQFQWLEEKMKASPSLTKILFYHNVAGGWPINHDGTPGGYGRGMGFTEADYQKYNQLFLGKSGFTTINIANIEQLKMTELALKYKAPIGTAHDHIFVPPRVIKSGNSQISVFKVGCDGETIQEIGWSKIEPWPTEYGSPWQKKFLFPPASSRIKMSGATILVDLICTAWPNLYSNFSLSPGEIILSYFL
jgi:hypothetical protein